MKSLTDIGTQSLFLQRLDPVIARSVIQSGQVVHLGLKEVSIQPGVPLKFVDFPQHGVMSYLQPMDDGTEVETVNIGNEGMVGAHIIEANVPVSAICYCQIECTSLRVDVETFLELTRRYGELSTLVRLYMLTFVDQMSRNAGCKQAHSIKQRCAKWLLLTQDRCFNKQFVLTQEFLAKMLNVSRTVVNACAVELTEAGLITYVRGKVTVLDRPGLENASCSCYSSIHKYFDEVMGTFGSASSRIN